MKIILLGWNENTLEVAKSLHSLVGGSQLYVVIAWMKKEQSESLQSFCSNNGIEFIFGKKNILKDLELKKFDILVSASWPYVIDTHDLLSLKYGGINIHASLLPKYRGQHPINWALLNDDHLGVTVHKIEANLDDGDIFMQQEILYSDSDTLLILRDKIHYAGAKLVANVIHQIELGVGNAIPQDKNFVSYAPKRNPEDGKIQWNKMNGRQIFNLVRATSHPGPGAFCYTKKEEKVVIWDSKLIMNNCERAVAGEIVDMLQKRPIIQLRDGTQLRVLSFAGPMLNKGEILI